MLLLPSVAVGGLVVVALARPLGQLAFGAPGFHYFAPELVVRKPTTQAGYVLIIGCVLAYALLVLRAPPAERVGARLRRALVLAAQAALVVFAVVAWIEQRNVHAGSIHRRYFTPATVIAAIAIAAGIALALRRSGRSAALASLRARGEGPASRAMGAACFAVAGLLAVVWLAPAVATDRSVASGTGEMIYLVRFAFDEASSVLNGRSPLVDMVTYSSLWPYVTSIPLTLFGGTYLAFSLLMMTITSGVLLAIYAAFRRVTRHPLAALAIWVPFLATSLFVINVAPGGARYFPGDYFAIFPLRYGGPYLLAWLVVRWADGARPRRHGLALLFAAAGLVAINNVDFGVAGLGATVAAVACAARPAGREQWLALARSFAAGLAGALAAVSLLTLLRAGSLPHLGLLVRYGRTFAAGGYGNLPLPGVGFHLLMTTTFVAAIGVAAVRVRARSEHRALTAMLAWSGVFGLGAGVYFYAYNSHPLALIHLFSSWALALVLLAFAVVREAWRRRRAPTLPELAVLVGFGLAVCSIAQVPKPWSELRRIRADTQVQPLREAELAALVASVSTRGERVAILDAMGHRVAREAGVTSVAPYTGLEQIGTSEQIDDVLRVLRDEGGRRVFMPTSVEDVPRAVPDGALAALRRRGFVVARSWPGLVELVPGPGGARGE
jgi:hypothetical protein